MKRGDENPAKRQKRDHPVQRPGKENVGVISTGEIAY